jgi:hypothetical protein
MADGDSLAAAVVLVVIPIVVVILPVAVLVMPVVLVVSIVVILVAVMTAVVIIVMVSVMAVVVLVVVSVIVFVVVTSVIVVLVVIRRTERQNDADVALSPSGEAGGETSWERGALAGQGRAEEPPAEVAGKRAAGDDEGEVKRVGRSAGVVKTEPGHFAGQEHAGEIHDRVAVEIDLAGDQQIGPGRAADQRAGSIDSDAHGCLFGGGSAGRRDLARNSAGYNQDRGGLGTHRQIVGGGIVTDDALGIEKKQRESGLHTQQSSGQPGSNRQDRRDGNRKNS